MASSAEVISGFLTDLARIARCAEASGDVVVGGCWVIVVVSSMS